MTTTTQPTYTKNLTGPATVEVIDHLDAQISRCETELRAAPATTLMWPCCKPRRGSDRCSATPSPPRSATSPGSLPPNSWSVTGLCPRVHQSGDTDRRGPLTKHGPRWLRWALIEAAIRACRHPHYQARHNRTVRRLGPQSGPKVARVDTAQRLATATWWMLTKGEPFAPADPRPPLAA